MHEFMYAMFNSVKYTGNFERGRYEAVVSST